MANYCTAEDVQVALGYDEAYNALGKPTLIQVNSIITDITNDLDFYLDSVGISSQPTDSRILGRLSKACIFGSAADVGFGYLNNADSVDGTLPEYYRRKYQEILEEIKERPELYGAIVNANAIYAQNQVTDGTMTEDEFKAQSHDADYEV